MALLVVAVGPLITGSRCDVRMGVGASGAGARRGRPRGTAVVGGAEPPMLEAHAALVSALRGLNFDNTAVRTLAVDPQLGGPVRQVRGAHVVRVEPTRLKSPELVATSEALGLLGLPLGSGGAEAADAGDDDDADADADAALLDPERLPLAIRSDLAAYLSGNEQLPGAEPFAAAYCGHQFGRFAGQLGDGAVISLGEIVNCGGGSCDAVGSELLGGEEEGGGGEEGCGGEGSAGEEAAGGPEQDGAVAAGGGRLGESAGGEVGSEGRWELQLKGAGPTPFSRAADGRKVLRSSIRELLASEAMHALRLPTTRAAALVSSDARVSRDAGNNGQLREERCAVLARVARSFLRFGSFELCLSETDGREGPSAGMTEEVLAPLFEYALQRHYPHLCSLPSRTQRVAAFVAEVARRTAQLVAGWQTVGFVHGVLNTDNMAITGDTIDYGPFGFVDQFDPDYSPNDSDAAGRYSYRQQPAVSAWNLRRLATALAPLGSEGGAAEAAVEAEAAFWVEYEPEVRRRWRSKLGLLLTDEGEADDALLESLLGVMQRTGADFTNTFRALSRVGWEASEAASYRAPQDFDAVLEYCLAQCASTEAMLKRARPIFHPKALARLAAIAQTEPERLAQFGLDASVVARETQRAARREALARVTPRDKRLSDAEAWRAWLHAYRLRLWRERRAVAGADDEDAPATAAALEAAAARRRAVMGAFNPRFVLRQHIAARVIERAEAGDYVELRRVQRLLAKPYDDQGHALVERYASLPPDWSHDLVLT